MQEVFDTYSALPAPFKILVWGLVVFVLLALLKKAVKVAILVTILVILIFVARAVYMSVL